MNGGREIHDLTTGAKRIVKAALAKRDEHKHSYLGINHWLLAVLERHGPMVSDLLGGVDAVELEQSVAKKLGQGELGQALDETVAAQLAGQVAGQRGKLQAAERDLAAVILTAAGYETRPEGQAGPPSKAASQTPMLDQFGRDLTAAASQGKLARMIGREEEVQLMMETLCRNTKRNPVLIGPAGVGKTAIVEGLANRMVIGRGAGAAQGRADRFLAAFGAGSRRGYARRPGKTHAGHPPRG